MKVSSRKIILFLNVLSLITLGEINPGNATLALGEHNQHSGADIDGKEHQENVQAFTSVNEEQEQHVGTYSREKQQQEISGTYNSTNEEQGNGTSNKTIEEQEHGTSNNTIEEEEHAGPSNITNEEQEQPQLKYYGEKRDSVWYDVQSIPVQDVNNTHTIDKRQDAVGESSGATDTLTSPGALSPGDQAKVAVSLETAQQALGGVQSFIASHADAIKNLQVSSTQQGAQNAALEKKLMKFASAVGTVMSFVSAAGAVFSVISTFFMPSQLDVIQEHFKAVNDKLDAISSQMQSIRDELKSSVEFNAWLTTYIEWENVIRNGENKLTETQGRLAQVDDERLRLRLMESFVNYFEDQDIEGKAMNIYRLTGVESSTTSSNLFELYAREKGCSVVELTRLMLVIRDLMTSTARQAVAYQFLKYASVEYARDKMSFFSDRLYDIRRQYQLSVWYCKRDSPKHAKEEAKKIIEENKGAAKEALSRYIQRRFVDLMPWYNWGVVLYEQISFSVEFVIPTITVEQNNKEEHFFFLPKADNNDFNVLVVWQDPQDQSHGCRDIGDANVFVPFQLCSGCTSDVLVTSDQMITGSDCPNYLRDTVVAQIINCRSETSDCSSLVGPYISREKYSFIASGFTSPRDPCLSLSAPCNNHGLCRHIPATSSHLCLCNEYYEGEFCEEYHDPATDNTFNDMVATLRLNFSGFIGVPSVIDVYFSIKEIPQQIELMRRQILDSNTFTQIVSLYGDVFRDAEYITAAFSQLQSGEINEDAYATRIDGTNFHRIISDLKTVILGRGILINGDFLSIYKKSLTSQSGSEQFACSESYSTAVAKMIDNLITLDQVVTEARLWNMRTRIRHFTPNEKRTKIREAKRILEEATRRRDEYSAFWNNTSCPEMKTEDLVQNYCLAGHSYGDLHVVLSCNHQKLPSPTTVSCTRTDGKMEWTAVPQCRYEWGSWNSWSSCSLTCDGGTRTRHRSKPNGSTMADTESCNTQDCCQRRYGKYKCSSGQCVSQSSVCDGDKDCADGSDEASCSYLRVGDTIALKNYCGEEGFLSCYCTVNCDQKCKTRPCPGTSMEGSDWENCKGESFNPIIATDRSRGDAIRFGDRIAIRYGWDSGQDKGYWLSCWGRGSSCTTRPCPGTNFKRNEVEDCRGEIFWIYAYNRRGSCGGNTDTHSTCIGEPIYPGDDVFFQYTPDDDEGGYWLSGKLMGEEVVTRTCPGRYFTHSISQDCMCERWKLYRR